MSDDDLIAVLHRHGRKVWNIWVGITPASERTREAAGNIGLCIEGCIRELKGWL